VGITIVAVTIRHIICVIVGKASGEEEAFVEYLQGVYQSYRFSALMLFLIMVLMFYSPLFTDKIYFTSGIIIIGLLYFIRIIRLLIIFLKRNISLFYLILYLCALEILPVLISVKYFSGLV
jgi:tryptophan-rich sensory protein